MATKTEIRQGATSLLIVEGTHDVDFFEAIFDAHQLNKDFVQILPLGGKTLLTRRTCILGKPPGRAIGI